MDDNREVVLELKGIGHSFRGLRANDDISFTVFSGDRLGIIGPNGAGKTTLFNIISGELTPTDGKVILFGENVTKLANNKRVQKGLARTYQITSLFPEQSVIENVILAIMGASRLRVKYSAFTSLKKSHALINQADELLERMGLLEHRGKVVKDLAYGAQRQLEVVLALAGNPRIICLDEPNAGLSAKERELEIKLIKNLDPSITMLLIEHDMDLVFEVVDRLIVLQDGKIIANDTKEGVRKNEQVQKIYLSAGED